jgi:hypothetical protein
MHALARSDCTNVPNATLLEAIFRVLEDPTQREAIALAARVVTDALGALRAGSTTQASAVLEKIAAILLHGGSHD